MHHSLIHIKKHLLNSGLVNNLKDPLSLRLLSYLGDQIKIEDPIYMKEGREFGEQVKTRLTKPVRPHNE